MPEAWVDPWSCIMVEKTLMRAPSIRLGFLVNNQGNKRPLLGLPVYDWGSWSGTKQLKPLDMSRAPGHGPRYPCLGHGFLGLGPSS
jgi:hypothetical protein